MTTAAATDDVRDYLAQVASRLECLPPEDRADLLDDLEQHLLEVAAEEGASLHERLGPPDAYAAELLASAGYDSDEGASAPPSLVQRVADMVRRLPWRQAYQSLAVHRPVWWVARGFVLGWMLADFLSGSHLHRGWFVLPSVEGNDLMGLLAVVAGIVVSVRLGHATSARPRWRALVGVGNAVVVLFALSLSGQAFDRSTIYVSSDRSYNPCMQNSNGTLVENIYAYDAEGKPLDTVLLYDQNGQPLDSVCSAAGVPVDERGMPVPNAYPRSDPDDYQARPEGPPKTIVPFRLSTTTTTTAPTSTTTTTTPP